MQKLKQKKDIGRSLLSDKCNRYATMYHMTTSA
jgi:hypothetical protein